MWVCSRLILIRTMKRIIFKLLFFVFLIHSGCAVPTVKEPLSLMPTAKSESAPDSLGKAFSIVQACLAAYDQIEDYTAVYHKEERLKSAKLRPKEIIFVKFRKPNQIYMKWIEEPNKGMELIYPVRENKLVVEPGGLLDVITPKMYLNPTDKLSMLENRHPITEADLGYLIGRYAEDFTTAKEKAEIRVRLNEGVDFKGVLADRVELFLPQNGYYCSRSVVYFDQKSRLPLHVEFYDIENQLFERYSYTQLQLNVGLQDIDFDEENPKYDF